MRATALAAVAALALACGAQAQGIKAEPSTKASDELKFVKDMEAKLDDAVNTKKTIVKAALGGPCGPGYYFPDYKKPCEACGVDYYCPGGKGNERVACPDGFTTAGVNTASSVDQCIITCPAGTYAVVNAGADALCLACGPGFFCAGGAQVNEERVSCKVGYTTVINDATGEKDCIIVCPAGQYAPDKYGPCIDCGFDNVCSGGPQLVPVIAPCPTDTPFTETTTSGSPGDCVGCPEGTSLRNGTCVPYCAPGFYLNATTDLSCTQCGVGKWCPGGPETSEVREDCPPGTTTTTPTGSSPSACIPVCEPGYYIAAGDDPPCVECGPAAYCQGGPQDVPENRVDCPPGSFTLTNTSSVVGQCQTCAVGTPPTCTVTTCDPGYYSPTPTGACQACGVGYTCPGGPQTTPQKTQCPNGLTTVTNTASATAECVRACQPGYYAATPTGTCQKCGTGNYCPGGIQDVPKKDPCPPSYTTMTQTASAQAQCVIVCDPGLFSPNPQPGPCQECGIGAWCPGGPQDTPQRTPCPPGNTTDTTTASSPDACFGYICEGGTLPLVDPPRNQTDCGIVQCDPCGASNPTVYYSGALSIYTVSDWSNSSAADPTVAGDAALLCTLDRTDPLLCSQKSTAQNDACTTNDIAVDGAGNLYVLGRTGGTYETSGWIIRIPAGQPAGQPCAYELVQSGITPVAGLGAAPSSDLLYAVGDNSVLTYQIQPDGSLVSLGSLAVDGFTGAGDITAAPDGTVWAISDGGNAAYQIKVDPASYVPTAALGPVAETGSTYPAAFCTSSGPVGVSSFGPFGQVSTFTDGTFTGIGQSGQLQSNKLSGAAVAPVCGTVPACTGGLVACNGGCIPVSADNNNCGACGNVCPASSTCTDGQCVCTGVDGNPVAPAVPAECGVRYKGEEAVTTYEYTLPTAGATFYADYDSKEIPDRYVFRAGSPCGDVIYDTGFTGEWGRGCRASAPCCNATKYSDGGPGCYGGGLNATLGPYCPPSFDGISPAAPPGGPGVGTTPNITLPGTTNKLYATAYGVCGGTLNRLTVNC